MNELQKIEFDLFKCFADICQELNLKYFLVCGSALGAARHKGFIPWDDDFDVGMYRDDYNKFIKLAPSLLPEEFFLQNYHTDPEFPYVFSKLRNSNTTFIQKILSNLNINHGIYIDIFPLDGCPNSYFELKKLNFLKKHYLRQLNAALNMPKTLSLRGKVTVGIFKFFGCHKRTVKILKKYEKLISRYPVKDSTIICNHGTWHGKRDYILKEIYGNGTQIIYEDAIVRVPEKYDEYLTSLYGDWRTPPPRDERDDPHNCEICDTTKSYTEYLKTSK